jgi:hypothetical protein
MRVRIKESSFCLRALRATLASFRMAAARSTLAHVPTTSSGGRVIAWQRQTLCATVMATGETLDLRELRCRCNLEYRFAYADGKPLDRPRQLWCVEPARSAVSSTFKPNYSRLILARWQGQAILPVSFVSSHMIEISLGQRIRELRDKADLSLRGLAKRIGISSPFLSDI